VRVLRFALFWAVSWVVTAGVWMVLVDTTYLPELLTGVVAAGIAATGTELVREQRIARVRMRIAYVPRLWRPLARVPLDIALLTGVAVRQAIRRDARVGGLRAVPFAAVDDSDPAGHGRRALAEGAGSFAPNTYVLGIDEERKIVLAHQLVRTKHARRALDPLELG
jgi:hypothetical protein